MADIKYILTISLNISILNFIDYDDQSSLIMYSISYADMGVMP